MSQYRTTPPTVGIVSLGCPKALVDSERILSRLRAEGYEVSPSYAGADVVVVNTCGTFALIFYRSGGALVSDEASMTGDLIILAGVVICAFGYVCGGKLSPIIGPWATTFWGLAVAMLFNLPALAFLMHRTDWAAVGSAGWLAVAYMTLFSSLIGYIAWFWAI